MWGALFPLFQHWVCRCACSGPMPAPAAGYQGILCCRPRMPWRLLSSEASTAVAARSGASGILVGRPAQGPCRLPLALLPVKLLIFGLHKEQEWDAVTGPHQSTSHAHRQAAAATPCWLARWSCDYTAATPSRQSPCHSCSVLPLHFCSVFASQPHLCSWQGGLAEPPPQG